MFTGEEQEDNKTSGVRIACNETVGRDRGSLRRPRPRSDCRATDDEDDQMNSYCSFHLQKCTIKSR